MQLIRKIDDMLNRITMYRLIVYVLSIYAALALAFSFAGVIHYSFFGLAASLGLVVVTCYVVNMVLSWVWSVGTNTESWLITALILFCIMPPATSVPRCAGIIAAASVAMAAKFMLALHGRHFFNPAAIGAVVAGWLGLSYASWWIGTPVMLPFVAVGGLLLVRKVRRFVVVGVFILISMIVTVGVAGMHGRPVLEVLRLAVLSGPIMFLATVMLTEPSTMPPRRSMQMAYASITALLFASQIGHGWWAVTPHMALVLGNGFSYAVSPKRRIRLQLKQKHQLASNIFDFEFTADAPLEHKPGQYLEWTLPHTRADDRGNRRTFTIASSPTEKTVHLGVKFYDPSSSFKRMLHAMEEGRQLWAGHVAGDFILPEDPAQPLAWVAGGIGVTPFRSMAKYLADTKQHRDIVLFYMVANAAELAYMDIFKQAEPYGLRVIPVVATQPPAGWHGLTGFLTPDVVTGQLPDYKNRQFYLSGPNAMVTNYRTMIIGMGVPRRHIVTDYFSGY